MKVETAFSVVDGRTLYMGLKPASLPREGETVQFAGEDMQGFPDTAFIVLGVSRTYDPDTGELVFVFVSLRQEGK
jgi:hypothetical protein